MASADQVCRQLNALKQNARNSGEVQHALSRMRLTNQKEYSLAIGAFAKVFDWRRALNLLREMSRNEIKPDMYCYSAALGALDKARQSKLALQLFEDMQADGCVS